MYSGYSSTTSFSSVASSSTNGSRRMIIPLYNLQAHNVMTNVVVDAGTDAKVAKYMRRGLEVINLAILEPVEVFGTSSTLSIQVPPPSSSTRTSIDGGRDVLNANLEHPHTPMSSVYSVSSAGLDTPVPNSASNPYHGDPPPSASGAKKIFGKFFKKKVVSHSPSSSITSPPVSPSPSPITSSFMKPMRSKTLSAPSGHPKRSSLLSASSTVPPLSPPPDGVAPSYYQPPSIILQPACLGIQPSLSAPSNNPRGRPHSYAWIVRRWIKGSDKSLLTNMMGVMNNISLSDERRNSRLPPEDSAQVEVQFIWTRGKTGARKRKEQSESAAADLSLPRSRNVSRRRSTGLTSSNAASTTSLDKASPVLALSRQQKRMSMASDRHSVSTGADGSDFGTTEAGVSHAVEIDDGEESDPEDSETPWTCTLIVRRMRGMREGGETAQHQAQIRVKVATLSPTPHHPKVVSMLKVPFPLPDIVVDQMKVRRRTLNAHGIARPSWIADGEDGLVLTAEEIKDVVSSTGLWLIVREGIGGVGKVSRKGDGWRIRA